MKSSNLLIFVGAVSIILSFIIIGFGDNYGGFFSMFLSIFSLVLGFIWRREDQKTASLKLDEDRLHTLQILEKVEISEERITAEISKDKNDKILESKVKQLMLRVTSELRKENLSKEFLLTKLDKPAYCILIHKTEEDNIKNHKLKAIRDSILPSLGFKHLNMSRGIYFLPPSNTPPLNSRETLEKWVKKKILNKIPPYHRYIFSFIAIIDLRFVLSIKEDRLTKKPYEVLFDKINPEEILTFSQGLTYLQKKKHLSIYDIINSPNLEFLLENTSLDIEKRQTIVINNQKIINILQKEIGKEIFTKDLAIIDSEIFKKNLMKYVDISLNDVEKIKENAGFWRNLLENNLIKS